MGPSQRVLLVDRDKLLTAALARVLKFVGVVVAHDLAQATRALETSKFCAVLLDIELPGGNSVAGRHSLLPIIAKKRPNIPILVMTARNDLDWVNDVAHAAVHSSARIVAWHKTSDLDLVIAFVLAALNVPPRTVREGVERLAQRYDLTKRQAQVLELRAHGKSNAEIGERLDIKEKTVATHIRDLRSKMEMSMTLILVALIQELVPVFG